MKRIVIAMLAGLLLLGSASAAAMNEYTLSPLVADTEAMLSLTFGDQAGNAVTDDRDLHFLRFAGCLQRTLLRVG